MNCRCDLSPNTWWAGSARTLARKRCERSPKMSTTIGQSAWPNKFPRQRQRPPILCLCQLQFLTTTRTNPIAEAFLKRFSCCLLIIWTTETTSARSLYVSGSETLLIQSQIRPIAYWLIKNALYSWRDAICTGYCTDMLSIADFAIINLDIYKWPWFWWTSTRSKPSSLSVYFWCIQRALANSRLQFLLVSEAHWSL